MGRQRGEQRQKNVTTLHLGLSAGPVPPAQQWQGRGRGTDTAAEQMAKFLDSHMCTRLCTCVHLCKYLTNIHVCILVLI